MHKHIAAAALAAMAFISSPLLAGEGHSCCASAGKAKAKTAAKCDPTNCPPGKCDKNAPAAKKVEAQRGAPAPAAAPVTKG